MFTKKMDTDVFYEKIKVSQNFEELQLKLFVWCQSHLVRWKIPLRVISVQSLRNFIAILKIFCSF